MTSKNNKAPLLYYIKLGESFQIHWWIQTGVTVWKCSIRVKIGNFLSLVTLKINVWPWKTIGYLFYTKSSFVHHFKSIAESQTWVTAWKHSSRVKIGDFFVPHDLENWRMTLKTIRHLSYAASTFVHHFTANGEFKLELQSGNAQFGSKSTIFFSCVTLKFDGWP